MVYIATLKYLEGCSGKEYEEAVSLCFLSVSVYLGEGKYWKHCQVFDDVYKNNKEHSGIKGSSRSV